MVFRESLNAKQGSGLGAALLQQSGAPATFLSALCLGGWHCGAGPAREAEHPCALRCCVPHLPELQAHLVLNQAHTAQPDWLELTLSSLRCSVTAAAPDFRLPTLAPSHIFLDFATFWIRQTAHRRTAANNTLSRCRPAAVGRPRCPLSLSFHRTGALPRRSPAHQGACVAAGRCCLRPHLGAAAQPAAAQPAAAQPAAGQPAAAQPAAGQALGLRLGGVQLRLKARAAGEALAEVGAEGGAGPADAAAAGADLRVEVARVGAPACVALWREPPGPRPRGAPGRRGGTARGRGAGGRARAPQLSLSVSVSTHESCSSQWRVPAGHWAPTCVPGLNPAGVLLPKSACSSARAPAEPRPWSRPPAVSGRSHTVRGWEGGRRSTSSATGR
jgi:hypothetical protein